MRIDLQVIADWVTPNSHVLDLGCGDGRLMAKLHHEKQATGYGIELDHQQVIESIANGVNVIQANINNGLQAFEDNSFDFVTMTQALQVMKRPDHQLDEMLRVGHQAIVTFPNFGHWRSRFYLFFKGLMPVSKALPHSWFDTPNIHLCTCRDFEKLCRDLNIKIVRKKVVDRDNKGGIGLKLLPNLLGELAMYHLTRY